MSELRWTVYNSPVTYLSSELNSLGNNSNKVGSAIDFASANRKMYMDIEIYLNTVNLSGQTNPALHLWLLPRTNGSDFEDGSDSITPARAPDKIIPLRAENTSQRVFARYLLTTPDQGKLLIKNKAGTSLASSGNTLKYMLYSQEIV